ncbi:MAG: hypothetical protein HY238_05860 [Acidobacteria bacterium]|nr:hypothetical protein [Acidobacteriota bacterium]
MNRPLWVLAGLLAGAWVAATQSLPTPPRKQGEPINRSIAAQIALHDARSRQYNPNCLASGCHPDIFNRTSLNSTIPPAHNRVAAMGIPAAQCTFCHESTEIVRGIEKGRGNAGKLGKNVDAERRCYPCHSQYGPAKKLYAR